MASERDATAPSGARPLATRFDFDLGRLLLMCVLCTAVGAQATVFAQGLRHGEPDRVDLVVAVASALGASSLIRRTRWTSSHD